MDDKGSGRSLLGPHGPTLSVDGLSTLQFCTDGHGLVTLQFSTDGCSGHSSVFGGWTVWTPVFHGQWSGHSSVFGHSSDSSQTSKEASLWQSKLLEFSLGHLRDRTWNISGDMGLVSAGRINKDTPPLTTPSHTSKSSAMDISSHIFQIEIHGATQRRFRRGRGPTSYDMRPEAYLYARKMREGRYHRFLARILT